MKCIWHSCQNEAGEQISKGKFCSKKCSNKYYVDKKRKSLKTKAVEYKGGKCRCCGYCASVWALDFHHIDPSLKEFGVSRKGHTISWDRLVREIDKCVLVCKNCHAEIHQGIRQLPPLDSNQESKINSLS